MSDKEVSDTIDEKIDEKLKKIMEQRDIHTDLIHDEDNINIYSEIQHVDLDKVQRISGGTNTLLYGVPGSGKSWTIEHEYCKSGTHVERLVFHPDYTNADFIGQILPVVDEDKQVTYEFVAGPFTTILRDAYRNPQRKFVLIIEEINRGNAPAIFGDIFQLLDRTVTEKTMDGVTYLAGTSEYGITNENVSKLMYDGDATKKVRIPSNLSILGTMNTSDQNVFTLDTAFQRRWRMRLIENNFDNVRLSLADAEILDTRVTWKRFCETANTIIIGNKAKMASAEDKRLGVYFVHENDLIFDNRALPSEGFVTLLVEYNDLIRHELLGNITPAQADRLFEIREAVIHNRAFPEKVIKYLWDDAFKFNPEALFDTESMDSLEKVIRTFVYNKGEERFKIFKQTVRESLYPTQQ
jgi:5-methylcytosine-specific restriction endonuclease McrBC GTP-binding regulatory subunit McrB